MKRALRFSIIFFVVLFISAFTAIDKNVAEDDNFCEDVKKITTAFNNKAFDQLKGKAVEDETAPNDKQYVSTVNLKNYISQFVYETGKEIYFAAVLNEDFKDADALKNQLKGIAEKLEKCLGITPEYRETRNFVFYTFELGKDVELELSGNYPGEDRRYINFEVSYQKNN